MGYVVDGTMHCVPLDFDLDDFSCNPTWSNRPDAPPANERAEDGRNNSNAPDRVDDDYADQLLD